MLRHRNSFSLQALFDSTPEGTHLHYSFPQQEISLYIFDLRPHPCRMRPQIKGLSHGLKKCPPDTFLPRFARPSSSNPQPKPIKTPPVWVAFLLVVLNLIYIFDMDFKDKKAEKA